MDLMQRRRLLMMDSSKAYTVTGNPVAFETNLAKPLRGMVIPFSPVQEGTGDPSPQNIRSIVGWTGLTAYRTGKNLFDEANADRYARYISVSTPVTWKKSSDSLSYVMKAKPNTTYIAKANNPNVSIFRVGILDRDPNTDDSSVDLVSGYQPASFQQTFTTPDRECWIVLQCNKVIAEVRGGMIQVELGSTATPYSPYSGSTYPVAFPADPGTIYGGYVDLAQGVVVAEYKIIKTEWGNYTLVAGDENYERKKYPHGGELILTNGGTAISNVAKKEWADALTSAHFYIGNSSIQMVLPTGTSSDLEVVVCAKLTNPITYPLSSFSIPTTLKGTNAIWTDTNGTNTIKYMKKG